MQTALNDYEVKYGKELLRTVKMLQVGALGSDSLRDVALIMKEATLQKFNTFENGSAEVFQYHNVCGDPGLIYYLSKYLTEEIYREPVDSADLYITNGASAGVWELLIRFLEPGDTVFCEDPTYKSLFPHLQASKYELVGIPTDEEGMNLDSLQEKLKQLKVRTPSESCPFTAAVYVIPTFHNPTTRNMGSDRKRKLVEIARQYNLLVICDDVYNLLCYSSPESDDPNTARPPKRIFAYDNKKDPDYKGNVVSVGTFSKFMAPGLRVGWYELPKRLYELVLNHYVCKSGSGRNPLVGALLGVALKQGAVKTHVTKMRVIYAERIKAAHEIIVSSLGKLGVKCHLPSGGSFLWIELPDSVSADDVLELSSSSVRFLPGGSASPTGSCKNCIRICITYYETKDLLAGVKDLCGFIQQAIEKARL